jgi:hypothetical protein
MSETNERRIVASEPAPPPPRPSTGKKGKKRRPDLRPAEQDVSAAAPEPARPDSRNPVRLAMSHAFNVDPMEVAKFQPSEAVTKVGEAIASGLTHPRAIQTAAGLGPEAVQNVLNDPVAMIWISQRIEALFRYRAGLVDAALFMRAVAGDTTAIKLFYERMKIMDAGSKTLNVHYSGGVDVRSLPTDDLKKIVADRARMLPAEFRVLESKPAVDEAPKPTGQDPS